MGTSESQPVTSLVALHHELLRDQQARRRPDRRDPERLASERGVPEASDGGPVKVMVIAFEGWNDAGEAASDALKFIGRSFTDTSVEVVETDDFYDFQFTRPHVSAEPDGSRKLSWPQTRFMRIPAASRELELLAVTSVEPSYKWREFCELFVQKALVWGADYVVMVGALLADSPHSRPIPVTLTSEDPQLRGAMALERPTYQGPVGIVGVLADTFEKAGFPTLSVWAAVPHYVANPPSPKASLGVVKALEELLDLHLNLDALQEDAQAWERGVDELAAEDPEVSTYVQQLEKAKDTVDLPEASGESIAREFERYLKKRKDQ